MPVPHRLRPLAALLPVALLASCARTTAPAEAPRARVAQPAPAAAALRPAPSTGRLSRPELAADVIPASAKAPWYAARRVDALSASSRSNFDSVWGDYFEKSEDPTYLFYQEQTRELGKAAGAAHATYTGLDFGSGVDSILLRVSLDAGTAPVEIRLGTATGPVVGTCTIAATGAGAYRTIGCPVDAQRVRSDGQTLTVRFPGATAGLRFNWFGYWARGTTQRIDDIVKAQLDTAVNRPSATAPIAGTAVRTASMLPAANVARSRGYGAWSPTQDGDCPKWLHDTHWVQGEDGKAYATWHAPVDWNPETQAYCTYGHDHGSDPRGSEVFALAGMPPFGYVNENHEPFNVALQRNEDHVGHKVIVANNWDMYSMTGGANRRCDVLVKIHVGTHSPDAFTNTAHELHAAGQCEGLQPFNLKYFALFGGAGSFKEAEAEGCNNPVNPGVAPTPANQPTGGVHRAIPARDCFLRGTAADRARLVQDRSTEFWLTGLTGGNLYYTIGNPSRYYDPASATKASRMVDLCYDATHPLAATLRCQETVAASSGRVPWNDARSSFRGTNHTNTHFSKLIFDNAPASIVYTNAWGQSQRTTPDAAAGITFKQRVPTTGFRYAVDGHASVVPQVDYSAGGRNGVRPPN